ncbi:MAG: 3-oxoacyl-ACP reductase FabG [Sporocytophaga sp.]|uniref:3-oxoacyl-ACP reductase FabG n=1 Tax=Sporocytophaga sp. TaxID=2231183 RepID=UPI001B265481|nr:3-oxoacyl-ACP reductase FabG [Sporocytophaga sp.]MBO9703015.1 3-oxoacyl-ACP reductase FabG [Sporocytophaga sp.]
MKKLEGKVSIITGGAQGIGKKTVERFSCEGSSVIIWDIDIEKGNETLKEIKANGMEDVTFMEVDTTRFAQVEEAARSVFASRGQIDILINNAGITRDAASLNMSIEQWQQVIDLNLTGVFNCTKAIAPYMVQKQFGRIINTSSLVGIYSNFGQANYAAAKSGLVGITKVWARELSRNGITVNAVAPGFIETESLKNVPEKIVRSIKDKIPVGRLGKPEDVSNAYIFLASEESSYISGSVLTIDGGFVS